jgi:hypothetical protein
MTRLNFGGRRDGRQTTYGPCGPTNLFGGNFGTKIGCSLQPVYDVFIIPTLIAYVFVACRFLIRSCPVLRSPPEIVIFVRIFQSGFMLAKWDKRRLKHNFPPKNQPYLRLKIIRSKEFRCLS